MAILKVNYQEFLYIKWREKQTNKQTSTIKQQNKNTIQLAELACYVLDRRECAIAHVCF